MFMTKEALVQELINIEIFRGKIDKSINRLIQNVRVFWRDGFSYFTGQIVTSRIVLIM